MLDIHHFTNEYFSNKDIVQKSDIEEIYLMVLNLGYKIKVPFFVIFSYLLSNIQNKFMIFQVLIRI